MLAVGDIHVENFGTWRDAEGRLVWGVNDFDDAARMPYAIDIVRLATSAVLAEVRGIRTGRSAIASCRDTATASPDSESRSCSIARYQELRDNFVVVR